MQKNICIVANGRLYKGITGDLKKGDMVIGVDRAAYWLIKQGITPDVAIGDFDSVTEGEMALILKKIKTVKRYVPEKDFTDTELAVRYAYGLKPDTVHIYGTSGTRMDHTLGAMHLLEPLAKRGISSVIRDETNEIQVLERSRTILKKGEGCRYVSIVPITHTIVITLSKFKYNIEKTTIRRGQTIGISNEFIGGQAEIIIHRGKAFVIQSRD